MQKYGRINFQPPGHQVIFMYDFSNIQKPLRWEFNPDEHVFNYYSRQNKLVIQYDMYKQYYDRVYSKEGWAGWKHIFVRVLDQVEPASTKTAKSVDKTTVNVPINLPENYQQGNPITFKKLREDGYAYMPDYTKLNRLIGKIQNNPQQAQAIQALQAEWRKVEEVKLTKELDRVEIFFDELERKANRLRVVHEYGSSVNESNFFSPCGRSRIDIALFRNPMEPQGVVYVAGAVMEMKTCTHGRLKPDNESQAAFEMLKLGTDMAIKNKLMQGEDVNKVIVYGILVDMFSVKGLLMKLVIDFIKKEGICQRATRSINLAQAFQIVQDKLINNRP